MGSLHTDNLLGIFVQNQALVELELLEYADWDFKMV